MGWLDLHTATPSHPSSQAATPTVKPPISCHKTGLFRKIYLIGVNIPLLRVAFILFLILSRYPCCSAYKMLSNLASKLGLTSKPASQSFLKPRDPSKNMLTKVDYTSNDIPIPDFFLSSPPEKPITTHPIDFANSPLPQYDGHTAIVLDNVLSPEECKELLSLAEASVPRPDESAPAWKPALISAGPGWEAPAPGYRESDRIIWNQQTVVDRLWERCMLSEGLRELLAVVPPQPYMKGGKWVFSRFNERMRFLKYSPGQFFKRKCSHLPSCS